MLIPRNLIEMTQTLISELEVIKWVHYRKLNQNITNYNYSIGTEVHFNEIKPNDGVFIEDLWLQIQKAITVTYEKLRDRTKCFSHYLHDDEGNIYRFSDHWGTVSSCHWTIGDQPLPHGIKRIGVANLKDFKPFIGEITPEKHMRISPLWAKGISSIGPTVDQLDWMKKHPAFKGLPVEDKKLIGENYGLFSRNYKLAIETLEKYGLANN